MPLVKIDYVVSFSSEDPINSITIGAYHVAVIEVLVGSSEKPNDPFEVLVPSCVLLAPAASRRGDSVECVRSFGAAQLAGAAARRWDRVRLACSQPYNKHCQFGLAFVHISSSDSQPQPAPPAPPVSRLLQLGADGSSDEEFRPGELFASHRRQGGSQSTDSQIRQASSQALNNISDASSKLTRAHIERRAPPAPRGADQQSGARPGGNEHAAGGRTGGSSRPPADERAGSSAGPAAAAHKRKRSDEPGPVCAELGSVLAGAAVALSGYVDPRRAALRSAALQLGARYLRDWGPACTHLVCAFPNTPKLRALRAAGGCAVAVTGEWLEQCVRRRRRLPWRWFAVEPQQRQPAPPLSDASEGDTDDEIEKVLEQQQGNKRRRSGTPDATGPADAVDAGGSTDAADGAGQMDASTDSDVTFVRDERVRAQISLHSDSDATDEEERAHHADSELITRESQLQADSSVQYVVGGAGEAAGAGARRVSPAWVWRQHARQGLAAAPP
ncbi:DNA repair protein XRCC1 isoform X2 [Bicyclus anynana]|uniref:DNA repair protein XRCC1 isoform X2 n=1 Tax=Bicyclus anynana TaxID=110368 RepID=A0ABM3LT46_BICAN|nr:DNA repair protein XRCC1 isoform X2 [Bicyclus anynana]